jgi:phenylpropionate dioxygenase-like ring-hydroxylating dioxygenase large terminal subunit
MSRFPFPRYPNGWFQVAYSTELPPGGVTPLRYFGKDLVLFRPEPSEAEPAPLPQVLDAHCPHMGAHIGHGGKVKGACVECPFHAWQFDGAGRCTSIPYAQKIPPKAALRAWPVREVNGLVMVWHHAQGAPPSWEVPALPEHGNDEWTPYECRRWKIRTHNQEMAENSVDIAHFRYLHGTADMPTIVETKPEGHVLHAVSQILMRTPMGKTGGTVDVHAYGFGFTTTRFKGIVETLLVSSATTIDEEHVDVRFSFTLKKLAHKDVTLTVGKHYIAEIERQLEQDIPIWENKIYVHPPLLAEGDGPIGLYRKWCRQFYSGTKAEPAPQVEEVATA